MLAIGLVPGGIIGRQVAPRKFVAQKEQYEICGLPEIGKIGGKMGRCAGA